MEIRNYLPDLYGPDYLEKVNTEIKHLAEHSNIPFDEKFVRLGYSFMVIKAKELVEKQEKVPSLKALVSESYGEAAMYKYNIAGGVL